MPKPTLVQTVFGLPSQTYSFPDEKNYHSTKRMMRQLASDEKEENERRRRGNRQDVKRGIDRTIMLPRNNSHQMPRMFSDDVIPPQSSSRHHNSHNDDSDEDDLFYTPRSSPRSSVLLAIMPPTAMSSASSSHSTDADSLFSTSPSVSTGYTTPLTSDYAHKPSTKEVIRVRQAADRARRMSCTYTDEDWAKDVRWLSHPASSQDDVVSKPLYPRTKAKHRASTEPSSPYSTSRRRSSSAKSRSTPTIMRNMSALIEEEEENGVMFIPVNKSPKGSVSSPTPIPRTAKSSTDRTSISSAERARPRLNRRQSRSLEDLSVIVKSIASSSDGSIIVPASEIPSLPSSGTAGYTSLTLPRAPPPLGSAFTRSRRSSILGISSNDEIDLSRSGIAQTTMASVEVVKGLGSESSRFNKKSIIGGFSLLLGRKRTTSLVTQPSSPHIRSKSSGGIADDAECLLGFTSYRKPPSSLPGEHILVQVWCVGVDEIDARLLGLQVGSSATIPPLKMASGPGRLMRSMSLRSSKDAHIRGNSADSFRMRMRPDVGYVPGRSFVGRVLECGWEIRDEVIRKGDWVVGLLDPKKGGGLQEFITVEKHRVYRVPHSISSQTDWSNMSRGLEIRSKPKAKTRPTIKQATVSLEEMALLPLCGVSAYRAVQMLSLLDSTAPVRRILVLSGHDGSGALATQMLIRKGWDVCVHVPFPNSLIKRRTEVQDQYTRTIEERIRSWGANEVIFDDGNTDSVSESTQINEKLGSASVTTPPAANTHSAAVVRCIERLINDGDIFDAVLDTIGGKEIWDASERLLMATHALPSSRSRSSMRKISPKDNCSPERPVGSTNGKGAAQFVTLVGDYPNRPIPTASDVFKTNLRSMKHSRKGDASAATAIHDNVEYIWVNSTQTVDWDGADVRETLQAVVRLMLEAGIRPQLPSGDDSIVPLEQSPKIFINNGPLKDGYTRVIRVAG